MAEEKESTENVAENRFSEVKKEIFNVPEKIDVDDGIISRVINVSRVAKVIRGGRRFGFSTLVVVGDQNGQVGIGHGKGREVSIAITKAENAAKKSLVTVPLINNTIPHPITVRSSAGMVMLKPAAPGTGVIAGGTIRAIMDCAGVADILTKSMGSSNTLNIVKATMKALSLLEKPETVAARRGLPVERVAQRCVVAQKNKPETKTKKNSKKKEDSKKTEGEK